MIQKFYEENAESKESVKIEVENENEISSRKSESDRKTQDVST